MRADQHLVPLLHPRYPDRPALIHLIFQVEAELLRRRKVPVKRGVAAVRPIRPEESGRVDLFIWEVGERRVAIVDRIDGDRMRFERLACSREKGRGEVEM